MKDIGRLLREPKSLTRKRFDLHEASASTMDFRCIARTCTGTSDLIAQR